MELIIMNGNYPCFERYLNFYFHYSLCHKKGVVMRAMDRVILLSHLMFHEKNLIDTVHTFLDDSYSLHFIFSTILNKLKNNK